MQGYAFLALVDIAAHLRDQLPQNTNFGCVNRPFSSQTCQILAVHVIKNYCIDHKLILMRDRDPQYLLRVLQICSKQIQDGGGRHLEKSKNRNISFMNGRVSREFGKVMCLDRLGLLSI